jgi:uncharacterized protein YlaI
MKTVTYKCNLCQDTKEVKDIRGIYFAGNTFEFRPIYDCNTHLCQECIDRIVTLNAADAGLRERTVAP